MSGVPHSRRQPAGNHSQSSLPAGFLTALRAAGNQVLFRTPFNAIGGKLLQDKKPAFRKPRRGVGAEVPKRRQRAQAARCASHLSN
jgi:hypothetical protein